MTYPWEKDTCYPWVIHGLPVSNENLQVPVKNSQVSVDILITIPRFIKINNKITKKYVYNSFTITFIDYSNNNNFFNIYKEDIYVNIQILLSQKAKL